MSNRTKHYHRRRLAAYPFEGTESFDIVAHHAVFNHATMLRCFFFLFSLAGAPTLVSRALLLTKGGSSLQELVSCSWFSCPPRPLFASAMSPGRALSPFFGSPSANSRQPGEFYSPPSPACTTKRRQARPNSLAPRALLYAPAAGISSRTSSCPKRFTGRGGWTRTRSSGIKRSR